MPVGLVLSGGGAKGSFEVGALQRLYEEGFFAQVICGSSVGAINGVKLAEGGTPSDQKTAFEQLQRIWESLELDSHMYELTPWLATAERMKEDGRLRELLTGVGELASHVMELDRPIVGPRDVERLMVDTPRLMALSWDVATKVISSAEEYGDDVREVVDGFRDAVSLATLAPIAARLRGAELSPVKVSGSGVELRLAVVSLQTGRTRYVDQHGAVIDDAGMSHEESPVGLPATCQPLNNELDSIKEQRKQRYHAELESNLSAGLRYPEAIRLALNACTDLDERIVSLDAQVRQCRADNSQPVPLKVGLVDGVVASATIPVAFPPVRLGLEDYVDGGVREIIPFAGAKLANADHVVAISASPLTTEWSGPWTMPDELRLLAIALRGLDLALNEIQVSDIPQPRPLLIAPRLEVHGMLTIEKGLIRINADYGYMCAADAVGIARRTNARVNPLTGEVFQVRPGMRPVGVGPAGQRLDLAQPQHWAATADVITRLRVRAWTMEWVLHMLRSKLNNDVSELHQLVRLVKRVIRHFVGEREMAGAPGPSGQITETWWGGWELHTGFILPEFPTAPMPGGATDTGSDEPLAFVRDAAGTTTFALKESSRSPMSAAAIANAGSKAQSAPRLPTELLADIPLGNPIT